MGTQGGGARRDRTVDLNAASVALSQLSYGPETDAHHMNPARVSQALFCSFLNKFSIALFQALELLLAHATQRTDCLP